MEKKQSVKPQQRQLESSKLRGVAGGARFYRPGYTDTGEPMYDDGEGDGTGGDAGRIHIPLG